MQKIGCIHKMTCNITITDTIDMGMFNEIFNVIEDCIENLDDEIVITIMSEGGDAFAASGLLDYLNEIRDKIHIVTKGYGIVASSAFLIWLAGHERQLSKNAVLLVHSMNVDGGFSEHELREEQRLMTHMNNIIRQELRDKTIMVEKDIKLYFEKDRYIFYDKAVELGLVNA